MIQIFNANVDIEKKIKISIIGKEKLKKNINSNLKIYQTKNNSYTASYNEIFLHSKYNPENEAVHLLKTIKFNEYDCIIILVMGLGYVAEALYKKYPKIPMIFIEPDAGLCNAILHTTNIFEKEFVTNSILLVEPTIKQIIDYLYQNKYFNPVIITTNAAKNIIPVELIKNFMIEINEYTKKVEINKKTLENFNYRWLSNTIHNLQSHNLPLYPISILENTLKNIPCVLCGGGPSLYESSEHINELSKFMTIICVDTALPVLYERNTAPDFIVTADPQYINTKHMEWHLNWALDNGSIIVMDITAASQVCHNIKNKSPVIINLTEIPFVMYLTENSNFTKKLNSGGSIAHMGWSLAKYLGSKDIYTLGLDLSYTQNRTHSPGTQFEVNIYYQNTKLNSIENIYIKKINLKNKKTFTHTYDNKLVATTYTLLEFLNWFEKEIAMNKDINNYSFISNSAKIEGVKVCNNLDYTTLKNQRMTINSIKQTLFDNTTDKAKMNEIFFNIINFYKDLNNLINILDEILKNADLSEYKVIFNFYSDNIKNNTVFKLLEFFYSDFKFIENTSNDINIKKDFFLDYLYLIKHRILTVFNIIKYSNNIL